MNKKLICFSLGLLLIFNSYPSLSSMQETEDDIKQVTPKPGYIVEFRFGDPKNGLPITKSLKIDKFSFDKSRILETTHSEGDIIEPYQIFKIKLNFEDNETYINTQGLVKRVTKLIHFKKESKNNWQIIRKFYANSKKLPYLNNVKDSNLLNFDCINILNYKNYINFQFSASSSLTSLSFYLNKNNKPIIKNSKSSLKDTKIKMFNTKLKCWLDDFFMGSNKDSFSYNSSVMSKNSKIVRINSSNFF